MTAPVVLGFAVLVLAAAEAVMLAFWVPSYLRRGITVARRAVAVSGPMPPLDALEARCCGGPFTSRLVFRYVSDREVAFQEAASVTFWSPLPVIRGRIVAAPARRRAEVSGVLLWYPVVAVVMLFIALLSEGTWIAAALTMAAAGAVSVMAALQWARYDAVVRALGALQVPESSEP